jgi:hypothetical protein
VRAVRRAGLAAVAALALGGAPAGAQHPAARGADGACRDATGITVVVDRTHFGGTVEVRCARQPVSSGIDALQRAGFTVTGTAQFPGLLCRIDGDPAADPCRGAPPASAYWGYWHAPRGGSWTYSTTGAGSRTPPPGSVEGWAFGARAEPGVGPPARPAPASATTVPPPPAAGVEEPSGPPAAGEPAPGGSAPASTTPTVSNPAGRTTSSTGATLDGDSPAAGEDRESALPAAGTAVAGGSGRAGGGSPAGALAALALVVAAVVGGLVLRRRRVGHGAGG